MTVTGPQERYRLLVELSRVVNSTLNLRQVFGRAAREVHRLTGADRVSLVLIDHAAGKRHGYALEFPGTVRWVEIPSQDLSDSAAASVLESKRLRTVIDLEEVRAFPEDRALFDQGYRACVHIPLLCRNQGVGVLGVSTRDRDRLRAWDVELLRELGEILAIALDNATAYAQVAALKAQLERENVYLRDEARAAADPNLIGSTPAMQAVLRAIEQVAPTDSTVLITGETGTGKELIARAIHERSPRRSHLLVKVNCAALAPGVITSELFGHEPGAFTGAAKRRIGRFELAHGGSIFLDEIAEVPPETQVMLLRVLQERVIERVGGNDPISINVRVITATNRDLGAAVAEGGFRADLFYRLNVFPIRVPALRERRDDIPLLVEHFRERFNQRMNRQVERVNTRTLQLLQAYPWPGNVRELENIIERAMIVSAGETLEVDPTWLAGPRHGDDTMGSLAEVERRKIVEALERSGGKIYGPGGAAAALGLKPTTLYGKMRKHGIRKEPGSTHYR